MSLQEVVSCCCQPGISHMHPCPPQNNIAILHIAYFIHVDNETRVYIYCINFCQTIMVPFTVCLPPIIFRWKYICDKLLCWTLLPKGWWDLSVHFYVLGRSGLLIFRAVAEPRNSGKSAKSHEIHKNAKNTTKFGRNLIRYMSVQLIWNLFQLLGLFTCHKLANLS